MKGFSLIEMLVAIAILGTILALGLVFGLDSFKGYLARSDRDTLNSVLARARSRAMNNMYQTPHGVCFDDDNSDFILFRGNTYIPGASTNEVIEGNDGAVITSMPNFFFCEVGPGVVFSQLSGRTTGVEIGVVEGGRVSTTTINNEGTIIW